MTATEASVCPACGADAFGVHNGEPVTVGGWHGGLRFAWGRVGGVRVVRCTGKRCVACGHEEPAVPGFDSRD